jgi:murein DD-endopeptidase MepM/ murein hydrolase activator NlpD
VRQLTYIFALWFLLTPLNQAQAAPVGQPAATRVVQPGDTWPALALRYGLEVSALKKANPHMNVERQPAIGDTVAIPGEGAERSGRLIRPNNGLVQTAARHSLSPWVLAQLNGLSSPYLPTFYQPLYAPGEGEIIDLPLGIDRLELSQVPAAPGVALGLRGVLTHSLVEPESVSGRLDGLLVSFAQTDGRFAGVVGTGAFYAGGQPELMLQVGDEPAWFQPWAFAGREWEYQELTLTGEAAQIDQQARDEERARLRELWAQVSPTPQWATPFQTPIVDYLGVSANYGARRSYNGGPYLTYHEGVDYSAYAGTPVYAPAAGTVALAEPLYVRGGAVIIDHGLGIFTGFYHLSAVHAQTGQQVQPGELLGEVGTTGLSTGNHLHWDMLINGIWVDAAAWQEQDLACWLLAGLGQSCIALPADQ